MQAIQVRTFGGPEVLEYVELPVPEPGEGEARVRVEAAGVNFIDVYQRSGTYPGGLPFIPGMEGAGVVDAAGPGVNAVNVGDRVVYAMRRGSYAQYHVVPVGRLAGVPDEVSTRDAAALMLQGSTAHYLTHSSFSVQPGHRVLVHAAAGGVGLLLVQIAKALGAEVYGTVSTGAKAELAREAGADHVILYSEVDSEREVRRLTGDNGIDVVYDSVGKTTFDQSLKCLTRRGYLVLFGQSSGPVPPVDLGLLGARGSLFVTRPSLVDHMVDSEEIRWRTGDLFAWLQSGELQLRVDDALPLADAVEAHRRLEGRRTAGKLLLIP